MGSGLDLDALLRLEEEARLIDEQQEALERHLAAEAAEQAYFDDLALSAEYELTDDDTVICSQRSRSPTPPSSADLALVRLHGVGCGRDPGFAPQPASCSPLPTGFSHAYAALGSALEMVARGACTVDHFLFQAAVIASFIQPGPLADSYAGGPGSADDGSAPADAGTAEEAPIYVPSSPASSAE